MGTLVGIDEVGRGCWAGPLLVVAARQITELPAGLADSKTLSRRRRESLASDIMLACELGEGWVEPSEIDLLGLTAAMRLGVARALTALQVQADEPIILDGNINYCDIAFTKVQAVIKADAIHPVVSAASIYAKVRRDTYMAEAAIRFPAYQFEKHVGYGTKLHRELLARHGACVLHRHSFAPVKAHL